MFTSLVIFLRISFVQNLRKTFIVNEVFSSIISVFVFFSLLFFSILYYLFDNASNFSSIQGTAPGESFLLTLASDNFLLDQHFISLNPVAIYYFPFLYIFILITVLSILFCLSYNTNELTTFIFCLLYTSDAADDL